MAQIDELAEYAANRRDLLFWTWGEGHALVLDALLLSVFQYMYWLASLVQKQAVVAVAAWGESRRLTRVV
jgi:hypothetical protein